MWLDVRQVKTIDKSEEAKQSGWHDLVVPENFSKLLLSLVHKHVSGSQKEKWESKARSGSKFQIDLVRDKGRGLVILLHGPPGTGKTSTAETIAAYTGRPLYSITCGDIGVSPTEVENHLVKHTRLAERWGCVLLLDEADVFLEQRSWRDMTRNAIVSGEIPISSLREYRFSTNSVVSVPPTAGILLWHLVSHNKHGRYDR